MMMVMMLCHAMRNMMMMRMLMMWMLMIMMSKRVGMMFMKISRGWQSCNEEHNDNVDVEDGHDEHVDHEAWHRQHFRLSIC